jgi:protein-disulfide isomerase
MSRFESIISNSSAIIVALAAVAIAYSKLRPNSDRRPADDMSRLADEVQLVPMWERFANAGHRVGSDSTSFKLVVFSDFQCPYCAKFQDSLAAFESRFHKQVAVIYRHYPLTTLHPAAFEAALASECAAAQGGYQAYQNILFANQDSIGHIPWDRFASLASIPDLDGFRHCFATRQFENRVRADKTAGDSLGIQGTPAILGGGQMVYGAVSPTQLNRMVSAEAN